MIFNGKQLLIFDLDGTLVDSAPDLANSINIMLKALELTPFSPDVVRSWVGNGAKTLVERALSGGALINSDLDEELKSKALASFLAIYRQNVCIDTILYPHVHETLATLRSRGFRLAIVTNKPIEFVGPILDSLGLNGVFELILGGDCLTVKKPDPAPLLHVCTALSVLPQHSLMIGDSKNDIVAAKQANIDSVGLTYGYNYDEDISVYQPNYVTGNFSELLDCLPAANSEAV